ncbi:aminoacyl-histidine dipeptidase [Microaceticoccus formicicus]|uniref:aminoacyl-histidine dipeptidase n=1 Tax=Microaceticoccus formicicus TaxID=3118105 RepID=UPI003CD04E23|nr:aminoacyl-histidine dipeptidase [Peptoniphilaceae bacterium AMB_02]
MYNELEPKEVFYWFKKLSEIPRCSGDEKRVSDFLVEFAKDRNLEVKQDSESNVIIKKAGTEGFENSVPIIIQGHMDMVCVKTEESNHDFICDPIELIVEGDIIRANNTTLGADNGIAVAFGLAILDSNEIPHPPLELLVTTNEETGMDGAAIVKGEDFKGKMLLNIDSEEEGVFLVSCAGGVNQTVSFTLEKEANTQKAAQIVVSGLKGGHSGMEIIKQRGNAIKILTRVLYKLREEIGIRICTITGGSKHNVIPSNAQSIISLRDYDKAVQIVSKLTSDIQEEYRVEEPGLKIEISETNANEKLVRNVSNDILDFLMIAPNGVQSMSKDIENLVQTSLNIGVLEEIDDQLKVILALRSSSASSLEELSGVVRTAAHRTCAEIIPSNAYPAWQYEAESKIRDLSLEVYSEVFNKEAEVSAIHAGLECGILKEAMPDVEMISFGPNITGAHTVAESLSINSVQNIWKFTLALLGKLK